MLDQAAKNEQAMDLLLNGEFISTDFHEVKSRCEKGISSLEKKLPDIIHASRIIDCVPFDDLSCFSRSIASDFVRNSSISAITQGGYLIVCPFVVNSLCEINRFSRFEVVTNVNLVESLGE